VRGSATPTRAVPRGGARRPRRSGWISIDGIIVRLTRRARKVAVVAARDLGNPALAHAFRLDKLYRTRGGAAPGAGEDEEPDDDEGGDEGGAA
jgi:hypothetical protein